MFGDVPVTAHYECLRAFHHACLLFHNHVWREAFGKEELRLQIFIWREDLRCSLCDSFCDSFGHLGLVWCRRHGDAILAPRFHHGKKVLIENRRRSNLTHRNCLDLVLSFLSDFFAVCPWNLGTVDSVDLGCFRSKLASLDISQLGFSLSSVMCLLVLGSRPMPGL